MEDSLHIVFCTKEKDEKVDKLIENIKETCGCEPKITVCLNPEGEGLTKAYNEILDMPEIDGDTIVFIHDDIEFMREGWGKEVLRLFEEHEDYGIIGVAGSAEFDQMGAWWQYKKIFGQVLHRSEGKSWLTTFSPLLDHDLEEVCVIDGLFMAIRKDRIGKRFDEENFGMQFYDISFCLDNFLDGCTKIGVTTNIRIAHNSVGALKPEWHESKQKMIEKYSQYFPITVKK